MHFRSVFLVLGISLSGLLGGLPGGLLSAQPSAAHQPTPSEASHENEQQVRETPPLRLDSGDRVVFVGNTFAERMGRFGNFETMLAIRRPELQLTFRCLGWSADTPEIQLRPLNFGAIHQHLSEQKADVLLLCFGMSESFAGEAGLQAFVDSMQSMISDMQQRHYNGASAPRLVLVSPIPHEAMGGEFPDQSQHNAQLLLYTQALQQLAEKNRLPFIDLYHSLNPYMEQPGGPKLTINGIHLSAYGDWVAAQVMLKQLGFGPETPEITIDLEGLAVDSQQVKVGTISPDGATYRFPASFSHLLLPPAPKAKSITHFSETVAKQDDQLSLPLDDSPLVTVRNLLPGTYTLAVDGEEVAKASHTQWGSGVPVTGDLLRKSAAALRDEVNAKNQQFFFRWRAVNGEYIYGRRKEPFGVISFPPEMKKLDEIVAGYDASIHRDAQVQQPMRFELRPAN